MMIFASWPPSSTTLPDVRVEAVDRHRDRVHLLDELRAERLLERPGSGAGHKDADGFQDERRRKSARRFDELLEDFLRLPRLVALVTGVDDGATLRSTATIFTVVEPTSTPNANPLFSSPLPSAELSRSMRTSLDRRYQTGGEPQV